MSYSEVHCHSLGQKEPGLCVCPDQSAPLAKEINLCFVKPHLHLLQPPALATCVCPDQLLVGEFLLPTFSWRSLMLA